MKNFLQPINSGIKKIGNGISKIIESTRWKISAAVLTTILTTGTAEANLHKDVNTPLRQQDTYIVLEGDSMSLIAEKTGVDLNFLYALNPHISGNKYIYPGQKISLKVNTDVYKIKSGDTFYGIARDLWYSVSDLQKSNPQIENIGTIFVGQELFLPKNDEKNTIKVNTPIKPVIQIDIPEIEDQKPVEKEIIASEDINAQEKEKSAKNYSELSQQVELSSYARELKKGVYVFQFPDDSTLHKTTLGQIFSEDQSMIYVQYKWYAKRSKITGEYHYISGKLKKKRAKVYNDTRVKALTEQEEIKLLAKYRNKKTQSQKLAELAVNAPVKPGGWCGRDVRPLINANVEWANIPLSWMDWYKYESEMDRLASEGLFAKVYVWVPSNAKEWATLVYGQTLDTNKGKKGISYNRMKYGHVEVVTAEGKYYHGPHMSTPGGSVTPEKIAKYGLDTGFTGYAYYPIAQVKGSNQADSIPNIASSETIDSQMNTVVKEDVVAINTHKPKIKVAEVLGEKINTTKVSNHPNVSPELFNVLEQKFDKNQLKSFLGNVEKSWLGVIWFLEASIEQQKEKYTSTSDLKEKRNYLKNIKGLEEFVQTYAYLDFVDDDWMKKAA